MNISSNNYKYRIQPIDGIYRFSSNDEKWKWILDNTKMLLKCCKRITADVSELDNDLNEIYLLTLDLLEHYNPDRGFRLSTYIYNYLPNKYLRYKQNDSLIHYNKPFLDRCNDIRNHPQEFYKDGKLDYMAIKKKYKAISDSYIARMELILDNSFRIGYCASGDWATIIDNNHYIRSSEYMDDKIDTEITLKRIYKGLHIPKRWIKVLKMHYEDEYTFKEISKKLGYSTARAHQIYTKAINNIRSKLENYDR